jgi:glycosyltransferase involved in cell wall biosynthesis
MDRKPNRLRLGIVTNQVMVPGICHLGGFGYAASTVSRYFAARPHLGVDPILLWCAPDAHPDQTRSFDGVPVLPAAGPGRWKSAVANAQIDLLLSIDYRPTYDRLFRTLRRTPLIVWVRDPRTHADAVKIQSLRLPGGRGGPPRGIGCFQVPGLRRVALRSLLDRRRMAFPFTSPDLARKFRGCYGWLRPLNVRVLPNIVERPSDQPCKSATPLVVFLGRLDPIKRPWLAVEVARALPDIRVAFLGQNHFPDVYSVEGLPPNVDMAGHVLGAAKSRWLSDAWALLNTSIHESLPVSFLEALQHETPLVSAIDTGGLTSSFGIRVPMTGGDGLDSVPALAAAVRRLIDDRPLAARLGRSGREWVHANHSPKAFVVAFESLCSRLGLTVPPGLALAGAD